jgi:PGM1 C-terminal domain
MLQFLTGGTYNTENGEFEMHDKKKRYYFASDNFKSEKCKGLMAHDLIDIAIRHDIHYNGTNEEGVMFHIIGALSQYGKLGIVCIGDSPEKANTFYKRTVDILDQMGNV